MIEKNPFKVFGANKDAKEQLLERMDITQLDKYSTMKNNPENHLKPNNNVKSIVDSIKREDMMHLLNSYPALKGEANYLINELINNGLEAFNNKVNQIVKDSSQKKNELSRKIELEGQEGSDKDILDRITQEIQNLMDNLTPEELEEVKKKELQKEGIEYSKDEE